MKKHILLLTIFLTSSLGISAENFKTENLVAWCIVPFDAEKRGPSERAEMVKGLGLTRIAYDWRKEHVPTFEQEILEYKKRDLTMFAFWAEHEDAFTLFKKHEIRPQIWKTLAAGKGETREEKIKTAALSMETLAKKTKELGCKLGLYNHGGWGGEPENLVAVCKYLHSLGYDHVGIVYNFHHGHAHIENWTDHFEKMKPFLHCLNLNGMIPGGDKTGKKIVTIGEGSAEKNMIDTIIKSGYDGPIGILDHRNETDSEKTLRANIDGLARLLKDGGIR